ncbi:AraC-type DNA-binding protein [Dyadobacter sp. SG02]|uniref:helix-turn-helix domain-containing protein n=1 Tax=Dyadobacter sp. SG02 TaxID=1855291 RepID=UPI0008AE3CD9|nr:helix-turn-helix domain-containing protein [Dyadobacter sp. SG02]SEJ32609.1 AraC-type DNA-binding protein [Dyadobacter sp. SG02]
MHQEFEPSEALRDIIKCFWYDNRGLADQEFIFQVEPDGYAEIIFYFGNLSNISEDGSLRPLPSPFLMGLLNRPAIFQVRGCLEIIGVRCFPWTVFDLLGLPPPGKNGIHIFAHPIAAIQSTLGSFMAAGRIDDALAQLEQYFLHTRPQAAIDNTLSKAGAAMRQANGTIPVSHVAAAAHSTVRTLERKFKRSSGFTVKDVSGLMRFEQVRNHLWHEPKSNLAGLAHELGYTDQAHLSREFKRYSGTTPAAFARNAQNRKLPVSDDFVAFVQA